MKILKIFIAILVFVPLFSSCQDDISDLENPRDAILKKWRVTDDFDAVGALGYDVTIAKDANETTGVLFTNFGGWDTSDKLIATVANNKITIPNQTIDTYQITNGSGTIANDLNSIEFTYTVFDGDETKIVSANFGQNFVKKAVAKKAK